MTFQDQGEMSVADLAFDLQNPRLTDSDLSENSTDLEVMTFLWNAMDVRELVMSIAASGFFRHEPLIVAKEGGRNIVIEGNRRLAAVKALLDPTQIDIPGANIPLIDLQAKDALRALPVVSGTRRAAWRYIGFKHVNGPAKWSSYAKSQYIAKVHREYGISLADISSQIGDTHQTVQRLYRGIMVIEQAERLGVFSRKDCNAPRFYFSHFYTGIGYKNMREFLGLGPESDENEEPVPPAKVGELEELFLWIYGSKSKDIQPVVRSQNPDLGYLNTVVGNRPATAALRSRGDLHYAHEVSRPSQNVFEQSLLEAKANLEKARGILSTGFDGSEDLLSIARDVANIADDLFEEMGRMHGSRRERRIQRRMQIQDSEPD